MWEEFRVAEAATDELLRRGLDAMPMPAVAAEVAEVEALERFEADDCDWAGA